MLYTCLEPRNAHVIERLFKVCSILQNILFADDPVGDGASAYDVYVRHLRAEQQFDGQRDLSSRDASGRSVVSPRSLHIACNAPLVVHSEAAEAPAQFRIKRKRDLQEALIQHNVYFKKMYKHEYGVEPCAYIKSIYMSMPRELHGIGYQRCAIRRWYLWTLSSC